MSRPPTRLNRTLRYSALVLYCSFIFYLSSRTISGPPLFVHADKVIHLVEYGILGALAFAAFRSHRLRPAAVFQAAWIFSAVYGLSDEIHQAFVPGRTPSVADWLMDVAGSGMAIWICRAILDRERHRSVS